MGCTVRNGEAECGDIRVTFEFSRWKVQDHWGIHLWGDRSPLQEVKGMPSCGVLDKRGYNFLGVSDHRGIKHDWDHEGRDNINQQRRGRDKEVKVTSPKPPMLKGVYDAQEVESFLWHLENHFKCKRMKSDESKLNTTVVYLSEIIMLWWRRKKYEIGKGCWTINVWDQFHEEFKKDLFPNKVIFRRSASLGNWSIQALYGQMCRS